MNVMSLDEQEGVAKGAIFLSACLVNAWLADLRGLRDMLIGVLRSLGSRRPPVQVALSVVSVFNLSPP